MKKLILLLAIPFYLSILSCSSLEPESTPSHQIKKTSADFNKTLPQIKRKVKSAKKGEAIPILQQYRNEYMGTDLETEIDLMMAQEYQKTEQWHEAGTSYLRAARSVAPVDKRLQYCLLASRSYQRAKEWENASKACEYCMVKLEIPKEKSLDLKIVKVQSLDNLGHHSLEALKLYVDIMASSKGETEAKYRNLAIQTVENKLDSSELSKVAYDSEYGFSRGYAFNKLGRMSVEKRDLSSAKNYFAKVSEILPETDLADSAHHSIEQMDFNQKVNASTVGVILPLSGKFANVGQRALRGLQMGLGLDGTSYSPIKLAIVDSEGNPDIARRAVEKLVKEDNVVSIVGSLLSKTANAVSDQAQVMGVPNIALSQKSGLTNIGDRVFRYALTSEMQVRTLVRHAIQDLGLKRFAIMYPNNKFGVEFANLFWDEVLARGGEVRAAQIYDPEDTDFQPYVQRLVGTFYVEDRQDEYAVAYKAWNEKQKASIRKKEAPEEALQPVVDFDAVFIADDLKVVGQIVPMLAFNNVKGVKILGPNLWNTDQVVKRLSNPFNPIIFVDNVQVGQAGLQPENETSFVKQYTSMFGEAPGSFEVQGYDVGYLLRQVLSKGVNSREDFIQRLSSAGTFNGALGPITVSDDREMTRPIVALTIENGQVKLSKEKK